MHIIVWIEGKETQNIIIKQPCIEVAHFGMTTLEGITMNVYHFVLVMEKDH